MLSGSKTQTNLGVGCGFGLMAIASWYLQVAEGNWVLTAVGVVVGLCGDGLFIWGCTRYAVGKGYHWTFGFFGLLSILGLLILVMLRDKNP